MRDLKKMTKNPNERQRTNFGKDSASEDDQLADHPDNMNVVLEEMDENTETTHNQ